MNITKEERIRRKMQKKGLIDVPDAKVISVHTHEDIAAEAKEKEQKKAIQQQKAAQAKTEIKQKQNMEKETEKNASANSDGASGNANTSSSNPFKKPVIEREYTKQPVEVTGNVPDSIPEPAFEKRVINMDEAGKQEGSQDIADDNAAENAGDNSGGDNGDSGNDANDGGGNNNGGGNDNGASDPPKTEPLRNPGMDEMEEKEAKKAANDMVDTIINGVEWMSELLRESCTISKTKLQRKALKGDFDMTSLDIPLNEEEGGGTLGENFDALNEIAVQGFAVTEEWKENVKKPLREILLKKQIGITPEQQLAYYGIQLGIQWSIAFATLKIAQRQIFKVLARLSRERNEARPSHNGNASNNNGYARTEDATAGYHQEQQEEHHEAASDAAQAKSEEEKIPSETEINEKINA